MQMWALLVGLLVFASIVGLLFVRRRLQERSRAANGDTAVREIAPSPATEVRSVAPGGVSGASARRPARRTRDQRTEDSAPPASAAELAIGIRSAVLRAVAERAPAGWSALVLCPPAHPERMTWHVHLAPDVGLDLEDGRTIPVSAPTPTHEWQLAGGRTASLGDGDPSPPPSGETTNIRVTGPYVLIEVSAQDGRPPMLTARVLGEGADDLPRPRASAVDARAVQGALREAVELAVGSKMTGPAPVAGYRPSSWAAHERVWLTVGRS